MLSSLGLLGGVAKEGGLRYNTMVGELKGELKKAEATSPPKRSFLLTSAGRVSPMLNYSTNRFRSQGKSGKPSLSQAPPSSSSSLEGLSSPLYLTTVDNLTSDISEDTSSGSGFRTLNEVIASSLEGVLERSGDGGVCEEFVSEFGYINAGELAERVRNCGKRFFVFECVECGANPVVPVSCDHRMCPRCRERFALKVKARVMKRVEGVYSVRHLVLTVPNVKRLRKEFYDWYRVCFSLLRRRKFFASRVRGGVYTFETKYNEERGDWHVHLHAVLLGERFIPREALLRAWNEIVSSRAHLAGQGEEWRERTALGCGVWIKSKPFGKGLMYILNGALKDNGFVHRPELLAEYLLAVRGKRLFVTFGELFGEKEEEFRLFCPVCGSFDLVYLGYWVGEESVRKLRHGWVLCKPPPVPF